eukprot:m.395185 g.395185  ORF g.395185 m.395185 type:complete len:64 (+) comp56388_c0_seq1:818-1009(+)
MDQQSNQVAEGCRSIKLTASSECVGLIVVFACVSVDVWLITTCCWPMQQVDSIRSRITTVLTS